MAKRKNETPSNLNIEILGGTYLHARTVTRILPAHTLSTVDQLTNHMKTVMRKRELMWELFHALDHLDQYAHQLGHAALVKPADHPLVTRITSPLKPKGE